MGKIEDKFKKLGIRDAVGQEVITDNLKLDLRGEKLNGKFIDTTHGDYDAHPPIPGSIEALVDNYNQGADGAYSEYRGRKDIRLYLAEKISEFCGTKIDGNKNIILTPGTQGALFIALGACVTAGDKVAIVEPDYFANRKMVAFFECELMPIELDYFGAEKDNKAGLNLTQLEDAFKKGAKVFLFSNPNNPTGVVYTEEEIKEIARLAKKYNAIVIVDQLYSRQIFDGRKYTHIINQNIDFENVITILGPSKTESMSGFRVGVAYGSEKIINRMEELQGITCLRTAGYNQAVLMRWFDEPEGWMENRLKVHQEIRDEVYDLFNNAEGIKVRKTEGGSYIFPKLPELDVSISDFGRILRVHANVVVAIGTEFGPQFTDSIRLNFSHDPEDIKDVSKRIIEMVKRYKK